MIIVNKPEVAEPMGQYLKAFDCLATLQDRLRQLDDERKSVRESIMEADRAMQPLAKDLAIALDLDVLRDGDRSIERLVAFGGHMYTVICDHGKPLEYTYLLHPEIVNSDR